MLSRYVALWLLLSLVFPAFCQVQVRGYYRKDGTYVQPHQRTYSNSTITDNYSYPGNYNPNTGRITGERSMVYPSAPTNGGYNSLYYNSPNYTNERAREAAIERQSYFNKKRQEIESSPLFKSGSIRFTTDLYNSEFDNSEKKQAAIVIINTNNVEVSTNAQWKTYRIQDIKSFTEPKYGTIFYYLSVLNNEVPLCIVYYDASQKKIEYTAEGPVTLQLTLKGIIISNELTKQKEEYKTIQVKLVN